MNLARRKFLRLTAGAVAFPAVSRIATAQTYPTRPVRLIVPVAAGGGLDIVARLVGQWLSERLGQPFIIENRPGAGANIGTEAVVRAYPDGYTLLTVSPPNFINATLYDRLNFNFIHDIVPIAGMVRQPLVMAVNPSVPAKTVPEFIAYAKANPGKINMASAGLGSGTHMTGELFKMMAGVNLTHVPYRGEAPALTDLLGGQVQVVFGSVPGLIDQGWRATRAGGDNGDALGAAAGHRDRGRLRAGLRGDLVEWRRRTPQYAHRDHRQAQQRDQRRAGRFHDEGAVCRARRHAACALARRVRQSSSPTKPRNGPR
jgi:hypothetical protein